MDLNDLKKLTPEERSKLIRELGEDFQHGQNMAQLEWNIGSRLVALVIGFIIMWIGLEILAAIGRAFFNSL